jgi:hypothetical protein
MKNMTEINPGIWEDTVEKMEVPFMFEESVEASDILPCTV